MDETTKTKRLWSDRERAILTGKGIDIGCGPDPVAADVRRFDIEDGDANTITRHVKEEFDYANQTTDQTLRPDAVAQIQCIVQKTA